ncbi:molybdenum ABC transporter ATP-binding protein [Kordiimonas sp.]|uniref:molybdenum ABC transporter ATP-binding protein n=1 Tax=Kordiimonas sp. TaxID=1970157 RepID=UPI003A94FDE4
MTAGMIRADFSGRLGGFSLNVAFEAPMQGITALFGRSGSGKTTLLRTIAGLTRLEGSFHLGDTCWQNKDGVFIPPHRRSVGYVFQEASLFAHLNVRQNLMFGMNRREKLAASKTDEAVSFQFDQVVHLLNIAPFLDRAPGTLSGGERQRIAIGRALLSQPDILLMDEPLAALDYASKQELLSYLEVLHRELSLPILYVSHDMAEVSRLADHVVMIENGKKTLSGPAGTVFSALDFQPPEGRQEASVVVKARLTGHDTENSLTKLQIGTQSLNIPLSRVEGNDEISVRIKACDVAIATKRPEFISIRNILKSTITEIRDDTNSGLSELLLDVEGATIRAQITHQAVRELGLKAGLEVFALIKSMSLTGHQT